METTNRTGTNPAGAQSRAGEAGANLSVGLADITHEEFCEIMRGFNQRFAGGPSKLEIYIEGRKSACAELQQTVDELRCFVQSCAGTAGTMVNGNRLAHRALAILVR